MKSGTKTMNPTHATETRMARIYFADGHVESFRNQVFAFAVWLALPKGVRVALRGKSDARPVYPWDYADVP